MTRQDDLARVKGYPGYCPLQKALKANFLLRWPGLPHNLGLYNTYRQVKRNARWSGYEKEILPGADAMHKPINNQQQVAAPLVSVIMNCLNAEKYLREAIDSVYAQTFDNWEIVFWDDYASTDSSAEIAQSYDRRLRYFRSDSNYPLGKARNFAIDQARGKYIAYLDCDDLWLPQKLELQVEKIENDPLLGMIYSDCFFINQDGGILKTFFKRTPPHEGSRAWFGLLTEPNFIPSPTPLIKLEIVKALGGVNDSLTHCEAFDLHLRLSFQHKIAYVNQQLAKYRLHGANLTGRGNRDATKELINVIHNFVKKLNYISLKDRLLINKRLSELRCKLMIQYLLGN